MHAVILAGGKGTRLAPYTTVLPKPLMPIGDMPILEIVIRQLAIHGICDITLAVGYLAELIEAYFGDGSKLSVRIQYSREIKPLGTAGPISLVSGLGETFLVMNGDLLTTVSYTEMLQFHRKRGAIATLAVFKREVNIDLGVLNVNSEGWVESYIEKPKIEYLVSTGIYIFEPEILSMIPADQHFDLPELVVKLKDAGKRVNVYHFDGQWLDIGRHEDYETAVNLFQQKRSSFLPDPSHKEL